MINRKWTQWFSLMLVLVLGVAITSTAANRSGGKGKLAKAATIEAGAFDGNRIYSFMKNNGTIVDQSVYGTGEGMYWPSLASLKNIDCCSGIWVAGKVGGVPVTAVAEPLASATAVRCSVKACVFPVPADGRSECRYHRLLQSEAVLFQSHQPSHLLLLYAPLDVPEESEEEVDDSREQDRKRLAAEREKFILDDPSELV